jgi:hypothetical protein
VKSVVLEALDRANRAAAIAEQTGNPVDHKIAVFAAQGIERAAWWEEKKAELRARGVVIHEEA